jgi:uncharacterized protein involved in response to NO
MSVLLATGFRPFFLAAALFALLSMAAWAATYAGILTLPLAGLAPITWHAHEMVYGYAMAVIAGFLLTAARNWTGQPTASGASLGALVALWLLARVLLLAGNAATLVVAAACDLLFQSALLVAVAQPILRVKQWRQLAILSKLLLLGLLNAAFYAGALGWLEPGVRWGLYGAFYLVIALVLTMARRIVPLFTERGVEPPVQLRNSRVLDLGSLVLLLVFWVAEVFASAPVTAAVCAAGVCAVNARRLALWFTPGILQRPLLWSLHLALALIALGFLLRALAALLPLSPFLPLHLMAIGGIGLVTVSMMARVSLGHSGRSVHEPPASVRWILLLMVAATLLRVGVPLLAPAFYRESVLASQLAWIAAFALFIVAWWPVLTRARIDGAPG